MLTIGLERGDDPEMCIVIDSEGIEYLKRTLSILEAQGGHTHLMTQEWGGIGLTSSGLDRDYKLINSLRIVKASG